MSNEQKQVGVVGVFDDPNVLYKAAEKVRDAGYQKWDCHTPYPIHGLEKAMGVKDSFIPYLTMGAAFCGLITAITLTGGLNAWYYPINIGGKALFSWQAFVPVMFELFVLFAAFTTFGSVIVFCKLFRWHHPLHDSGLMADVMCDKFALVINAEDDKYKEEATKRLLEKAGCSDVRPLMENVEEDGGLV